MVYRTLFILDAILVLHIKVMFLGMIFNESKGQFTQRTCRERLVF